MSTVYDHTGTFLEITAFYVALNTLLARNNELLYRDCNTGIAYPWIPAAFCISKFHD